ncbi:Hsp20 family protein [Consotaella salsifontis]|uniref:Molecular chaperone IbpA n=1 Tax=Consotaella salsifontis TaxID=1365950 RepID=A0A1T4SWS9_9HYPH|nr:Hsp20 family protein [Consotaella salsifontis]SKA32710.1 molecular chaperone IbpA [Consotaella salsifontis]
MRTSLDFAPLFRSSVGFDRMFDLLERAAEAQPVDSWPPYDIEKTGDNAYRIVLAVAGFTPDEVELTYQPNLLVVSGRKPGSDAPGHYLHRSIAGRSFERRFSLADHVSVVNATLADGLLSIDLVREVPEAMKPRQIAIRSDAGPQTERLSAAEDKAA